MASQFSIAWLLLGNIQPGIIAGFLFAMYHCTNKEKRITDKIFNPTC